METIIECCLGNTLPKGALPTDNAKNYGCEACEYIRENRVRRCCKFIAMAGKDATGKDVDEWKCSEAWLPLLIVQNSQFLRQNSAGIDKMVNESTKRQDQLNGILISAVNGSRQRPSTLLQSD